MAELPGLKSGCDAWLLRKRQRKTLVTDRMSEYKLSCTTGPEFCKRRVGPLAKAPYQV